MDILLLLGFLLHFSLEVLGADKLSETYEKFYTTDTSFMPTAGQQHSAMGISTLAKFSMLSNTPTLFKVRRPGLNSDVNSVSLESTQKPGVYLRYKNDKFHMEKDDGTEFFKKDATFREKLGPRGRAYELLGRENWFMCHTDTTPYTLSARPERIGTQDFVNNCVYVPVKQDIVEKKNIVKTLPSGGAMVVNQVPTTQSTDKCISIRFVNRLGGPVRVVSSLKPEGYLVTANAFKLKTIFKHANHKQRHVIFYAENVQDRDDDVMLNNQNVFTVKPHECLDDFKNVLLTSQSNDAQSNAATTKSTNGATSAVANNVPATSSTTPVQPLKELTPPALGDGATTLPAVDDGAPGPPGTALRNDAAPKLPGTSDTTPTSQGNTPVPSGVIVAKTTPSIVRPKPTAKNNDMFNVQGNPNVPASAVAASLPNYHATPNPNPNPPLQVNHQPALVGNAIGAPNTPKQAPSWTPNNPNQPPQLSYTAPLKNRLQNLDNVLKKRIQTARPGLSGAPYGYYFPASSGRNDGYGQWSSYGPCSVSCGVGLRRRTRICTPGTYCSGPAAETRACIKEQCASNCIHTTGGTVKESSCCHFPFSYNGAQYYHCILSPANNERMWCATTPYYEQDKQWGYCPRSAKAPIRSFVKPVKQVMPSQETPQSLLSSYDNNQYYNDPYKTEEEAYAPCNTMCLRVCDSACPKHCCQTVRADLPITAYMGSNYDKYDKRSSVYQYQQRYRRLLGIY